MVNFTPALRITTTLAQIGITRQQAKLQLKSQIPTLKLQTTFAKMYIKNNQPELRIDQRHIKAELGYYDAKEFCKHYARLGQKEAAAGTRRLAAEGDRFLQIENGGNAIAEIARENYITTAEVNLVSWPSRPPEITVVPGHVEIIVGLGGVRGDYDPAVVKGEITKGVLQVYLEQKPSIKIKVIDEKV